MSYISSNRKIIQCPRCLSPNVREGDSGGHICNGCGHWW